MKKTKPGGELNMAEQKAKDIVCACDKCGLANYPFKTVQENLGVTKGLYKCRRCGWKYVFFWR
jgi:hypothetical protein